MSPSLEQRQDILYPLCGLLNPRQAVLPAAAGVCFVKGEGEEKEEEEGVGIGKDPSSAGWPVPLSKQLDSFWPLMMLRCVSPSAKVMKECELQMDFFFKPKQFLFDEQEDSLSTTA